MKSRNLNGATMFLSGLGAGVAIALLFAPKSGEQMREHIKGTLSDFKGKAREQKSGLRDSFRQTKEQVSAAVEAGREAYRNAASRVGEEIDDTVSSM